MIKKILLFSILTVPLLLLGQENTTWKKSALIFTPEILVGKTIPANDNFPEIGLHKQLLLTLGRSHVKNPQEWAQQIKGLRTGLSFGISDFGNIDKLGVAFTVIPQIQFNIFGSQRFSLITGLGASYFTTTYDEITNVNNRAVTTHYNWAYRMFLNYNVFESKAIDWNLGAGYSHHSNGHTKLFNQGYNSFLISLSAAIKNPLKATEQNITAAPSYFDSDNYSYFSLRGGMGFKVLAEAFNKNKDVYSINVNYGKVYKNTWKFGIGLTYRFYEHYYNYIRDNEFLVRDGNEFESFKERPVWNASAFIVSANGEVLLNHVGLEVQLSYNIHKPSYKIDWRLNAGWQSTPREIPAGWILGEFDSNFKLKNSIATRLGVKYYLIGTTKQPKHNVFIGAHLNSNLGQADFTEMSFGYVYSFVK